MSNTWLLIRDELVVRDHAVAVRADLVHLVHGAAIHWHIRGLPTKPCHRQRRVARASAAAKTRIGCMHRILWSRDMANFLCDVILLRMPRMLPHTAQRPDDATRYFSVGSCYPAARGSRRRKIRLCDYLAAEPRLTLPAVAIALSGRLCRRAD